MYKFRLAVAQTLGFIVMVILLAIGAVVAIPALVMFYIIGTISPEKGLPPNEFKSRCESLTRRIERILDKKA